MKGRQRLPVADNPGAAMVIGGPGKVPSRPDRGLCRSWLEALVWTGLGDIRLFSMPPTLLWCRLDHPTVCPEVLPERSTQGPHTIARPSFDDDDDKARGKPTEGAAGGGRCQRQGTATQIPPLLTCRMLRWRDSGQIRSHCCAVHEVFASNTMGTMWVGLAACSLRLRQSRHCMRLYALRLHHFWWWCTVS